MDADPAVFPYLDAVAALNGVSTTPWVQRFEKVQKKDQNGEIISKAAKFLDDNDDSNVSVNVSLKNKALNYQNDSIFNDKEYKNDMN